MTRASRKIVAAGEKLARRTDTLVQERWAVRVRCGTSPVWDATFKSEAKARECFESCSLPGARELLVRRAGATRYTVVARRLDRGLLPSHGGG